MLRLGLLPWEYGVRNLLRRPWRSVLTVCALMTVVLLVLVVVGFIRGLESSLSVSGDPRVALVYSFGMTDNLEYSAVPASTSDLLTASLGVVKKRYGRNYCSPELYLATRVAVGNDSPATTGLVRGVEPSVLLVRSRVEIVRGTWPLAGEVLVGRLAPTKLGSDPEQLAIGESVTFEGQPWRISGYFTAGGSVLEAELWCRLDDLQQALKRQDLSLNLVALTLSHHDDFAEVDLFCKDRPDLELEASRETDYYSALSAHYHPARMLAWLLAGLVAGAGIFGTLNTMYASPTGRVRELATLQTLGFLRRVIALSLIQEATLLSLAGSLAAALLGQTLADGLAIRFTMGAFLLRIDSVAVLIGCGVGLLLGLVGALPPAVHALRMPVAEGLKAV